MECLKCGYTGDGVGKSDKCPHCMSLNVKVSIAEHFRVCYCCFRVDKVSCRSKARAKYCRSCSSRIRNTKDIKDLIRYRYACEKCGEERVLKAKTDAKMCKKCTLDTGRTKKNYSRVCKVCGVTESVRTVAASNNPICTKCQKQKRNSARYVGDSKIKKYQPIGTDGAKRNKVTVKFQVVDFETMEAPVKKREKKELPQLDRAVELAMQEEWLKHNSVKVG